MNTTRLRELCDAFDNGALRGEEMRELVGLAREAVRKIRIMRFDMYYTAGSLLQASNVIETVTDHNDEAVAEARVRAIQALEFAGIPFPLQ